MKYLAYIFFFFCFFPYIDILHIGTDTQPNALLLGAIIILSIKKKVVNAPIICLWVLFAFAIILAFGSNLSAFVTVKSVFNYLSPPIISWAAYSLFIQLGYRVSYKAFLSVILFYMFVGLMQNYFITDFMAFLVNDGARGILFSGRGVVSLCPEPAFYGTICMFFMIFGFLEYNKKQSLIAAGILLYQLVFLAKTATAVGAVGFAFLIFGVVQVLRLKIKYALLFLVLFSTVGLAYSYIQKTFEDTRMGILVDNVIEDPLQLAMIDQSAGVRITSSFAPFLVIKHNYWMPVGFGNYNSFLRKLYLEGKYRKLITPFILKDKQKIGGSINTAMFQLGFIGLLLPIAIFLSFKRLLYRDKLLFAFILFIILLFTQIQLMHSMIGLIIASAIFRSNQEEGIRIQGLNVS